MKTSNSLVTSRIKELRENLNLTQEDFAEKLDIDAQTVSLIERQKNGLNINTAIKISKQFNVSLDWLYELSNNTNDSASDILMKLKDIFDFDWAEKLIKIDGHLATFLEEISKAYKIREDTNMPDEPFNLWIEEIKRRYNENSKNKSGNKIYYYLQTSNEYFKEDDDKFLSDKPFDN